MPDPGPVHTGQSSAIQIQNGGVLPGLPDFDLRGLALAGKVCTEFSD